MLDIQLVPLLIIATLFAHIVADFHLQGILAKMKQKSWWREEIRSETLKMYGRDDDETIDIAIRFYRHDYIVCLLAHAFEWSVCISIPAMFIVGGCPWWLAGAIVANTIIHADVDHIKCNRHDTNLVQDQLWHMIQICWLLAIVVNMG